MIPTPLGSFDDKNRTACSTYDRFCHTSEYEPLKAAPSLSPHHDEIGHLAFRPIENDLNGIARRHHDIETGKIRPRGRHNFLNPLSEFVSF
jgi:hypothetical protein